MAKSRLSDSGLASRLVKSKNRQVIDGNSISTRRSSEDSGVVTEGNSKFKV
jgi:hypothetical protein